MKTGKGKSDKVKEMVSSGCNASLKIQITLWEGQWN